MFRMNFPAVNICQISNYATYHFDYSHAYVFTRQCHIITHLKINWVHGQDSGRHGVKRDQLFFA